MGNKDKDKGQHSDAEAMGEAGGAAKEACNACQASRDLSHERTATIDKLVVEAVARETAQITVTFTAILNQNKTANMPTRDQGYVPF